jgi:hypothetical protein
VYETQPGGSAAGQVDLPTIDLVYLDFSLPADTRDVVAIHEPDNGCPSGVQYTVATFSGSGTAQIALPYGTWRFEVPGETPSGGTWFTVTVDPRISGPTIANVEVL